MKQKFYFKCKYSNYISHLGGIYINEKQFTYYVGFEEL